MHLCNRPLFRFFHGITASYLAVFTGVLAILLLRLYYTFKGSPLEIRKTQKWFFIISYSFIACIAFIISLPDDIYIIINYNMYVISVMMGFGVILAVFTTIYAMILFTMKMYQLAIVLKDDTEDDKELLYVTTKYVTLLSIAIISSFVSWSVSIGLLLMRGNANVQRRSWLMYNTINCTLVCIDCTVNIICLYLQYSFAQRYYDKYCGWFGNCCTYLFQKWTLHKVERRTNDVEMMEEQMDSFETEVKL